MLRKSANKYRKSSKEEEEEFNVQIGERTSEEVTKWVGNKNVRIPATEDGESSYITCPSWALPTGASNAGDLAVLLD